ncbi:MAG: endonuclease domain-containing protein [Pararhizobium sp.]
MSKLDRFKRDAARRLRKEQTSAEEILWRHLWRIPVEGTHFRRQAPIGRYIVDFVSHRLKLVIELDGHQHAAPDAAARDDERDRWLTSQGYQVLRFWNGEVYAERDAVLDTIFHVVEKRTRTAIHPTPDLRSDPPHRGEGGDD